MISKDGRMTIDMLGKIKRVLSAAAAGCFALAICTGLSGCGGEGQSDEKWEKAIAATVNGDMNITEAEVNAYVAKYRSYAGYADDAAWASFLVSTQMTVQDVRKNAIAEVAQNKIVQQFAEKDEITIEDDYLDEYMENVKEGAGIDADDPDAWTEYLEKLGYTEETYRETVKDGMLLEEVQNAEVPEPKPTGDQLSAYANADPEQWTGKNSYTILFGFNTEVNEDGESESPTDEQRDAAYNSALKTIERIKETGVNLENIEAIGKELADDGTAQYADVAGFDCVQEFDASYQAALDTLEPGMICDTPVESAYGYHIIYCIEEFVAGPDGKINVGNMPDLLYEQLVSQVTSQLWEQDKSDWIEKQVNEADIKVNKCPSGLPYDVDLSLAEEADNENANENTNENANVNANASEEEAGEDGKTAADEDEAAGADQSGDEESEAVEAEAEGGASDGGAESSEDGNPAESTSENENTAAQNEEQ